MFNYHIFIFLTIASCVVCEDDFCVTYEFENDFDKEFSNFCDGSWSLRKYSDLGFDAPHVQSTVFIAPSLDMSCTSSFIFKMHKGGVVELSVYYSLLSEMDILHLVVYQKQWYGPDKIVGMKVINDNSNRGWNSLRIQLTGSDTYSGYFTIFGRASANSTIIVDSFKYESPLLIEEQFLCAVYESGTATEESPIIEEDSNTDEDTEITTTQKDTTANMSTTEGDSTTDTDTVASTTQHPEIEENGCVVYHFGQDFKTLFTADGVCRFSRNWELRNYSTLKVESPNAESVSCIVPSSATSSCTSSFIFPMSAGGIVEVNMYMQPMLLSDQVDVTVYQINEDGSSLVVGRASIVRQYGWSTIKIELAGNGDFNGQITIMSRNSIRSIIVVDHFRYIPPSLDEQQCPVYRKENY